MEKVALLQSRPHSSADYYTLLKSATYLNSNRRPYTTLRMVNSVMAGTVTRNNSEAITDVTRMLHHRQEIKYLTN